MKITQLLQKLKLDLAQANERKIREKGSENEKGDNYVTNSLFSDDKILALSKLKLSSNDKSNALPNIKLIFCMVESSVGKGENTGYQHFLLFQQCFGKTFT